MDYFELLRCNVWVRKKKLGKEKKVFFQFGG